MRPRLLSIILFIVFTGIMYSSAQTYHGEHAGEGVRAKIERLKAIFDEKNFLLTLQNKNFISESDFLLYKQYVENNLLLDNILFERYVISGALTDTTLDQYFNHLINKYSKDYDNFKKVGGQFKREQELKSRFRIAADASCANTGFELGTFEGWTGTVLDRNGGNRVNNFSQHCIMAQGSSDPLIATLNPVAPGSKFSARLGNTVAGGHLATLTHSFVVDSSNLLFTYKYAVVLENPNGDQNHNGERAPHFKARLLDGAGQEIKCFNYLKIVSDAVTEYTRQCTLFPAGRTGNWDSEDNIQINNNMGCGDGYVTGGPSTGNNCNSNLAMEIYYKDWTSVTIPLLDYIGQTVTIEFTTADCFPSGHLGYAYVDAECNPLRLGTGGAICAGQETKNITGPDGLKTYAWSGPGIISGKDQQTVTINQPGTYKLTLTPFSDIEVTCPIVLTYIVKDNCIINPKSDTLCETVSGTKIIEKLNLNNYNDSVTENGKWGNVVAWHSAKPASNANRVPNGTTDAKSGATYYAVTTMPLRSDTIPFAIYTFTKPKINFPVVPNLCEGIPAFNLNVTPTGGVFTGDRVSSTGNFDPSVPGSYNVSYRIVTPDGCVDSTGQIIQVDPNLYIKASNDTLVCVSSPVVPLKVVTKNPVAIQWTGGTATSFSPSTGSNTPVYSPTAAELQKGFLTLRVSTTVKNACPAVKDSVKISFEKLPVVNIRNILPICNDVPQIVLQGMTENYSNLNWYKLPDNTNVGKTATVNYNLSASDKSSKNISFRLEANALKVCPSEDDTVVVNIIPKPAVELQGEAVCTGDTAHLTSVVRNSADFPMNLFQYTWKKDGSALTHNDKSYSSTTAGIFELTVNYSNCIGSDTAKVVIHPLPVINIKPRYEFCDDDTSSIGLSEGDSLNNYLWKYESTGETVTMLQKAGIYHVSVIDNNGCANEKKTFVEIICPPRLYISNAFTPNEDDKNDSYRVHESHVGKFHMLIFNRWGEIIFESQDKNHHWDGVYKGEYMPIGVYPWIITYEGDTERYKGPYKMEGSVTVVK